MTIDQTLTFWKNRRSCTGDRATDKELAHALRFFAVEKSDEEVLAGTLKTAAQRLEKESSDEV